MSDLLQSRDSNGRGLRTRLRPKGASASSFHYIAWQKNYGISIYFSLHSLAEQVWIFYRAV